MASGEVSYYGLMSWNNNSGALRARTCVHQEVSGGGGRGVFRPEMASQSEHSKLERSWRSGRCWFSGAVLFTRRILTKPFLLQSSQPDVQDRSSVCDITAANWPK